MEEKKKVKTSLKVAIIIVYSIIIALGIGIYIYYRSQTLYSYRNGKSTTVYSDTTINVKGSEITYTAIEGSCSGTPDCIENTFVTSYEEFEKYMSQFEKTSVTVYNEDEEEHEKINVLYYFNSDFFENNTLAIAAHGGTYARNSYEIDNITLNRKKANINITFTRYSSSGVVGPTTYFTFITLDKDVAKAKFNITTKEVDNTWDFGTMYKPIIYLYPTEETEVQVTLGYPDKITCSYPKYTDGWNVLAKPNGDLVYLDSGRNLYSLYYECENLKNFEIKNDGFVVKGTEVAEFLEEKLAILGLTEREAEEFIVYWLPKLEANEYNYIRFATFDEITFEMPLDFSVEPDTLIRVLMTYKGLDEKIEVEEQQLETPERTGFVAVEWGGTEIK